MAQFGPASDLLRREGVREYYSREELSDAAREAGERRYSVADEYENKRRYGRLRLPLEVRWEGLSGKHEARVYDLSAGGCYIESMGQVMDGERIVFRVQTPRGRWLVLHGEIVHHQPNMGFGVRFLPLAPPTAQQLTELIRDARGAAGWEQSEG